MRYLYHLFGISVDIEISLFLSTVLIHDPLRSVLR